MSVRPTKSTPDYALAASRRQDDSRRSGLIVIGILFFAFTWMCSLYDRPPREDGGGTKLSCSSRVLEPPRQGCVCVCVSCCFVDEGGYGGGKGMGELLDAYLPCWPVGDDPLLCSELGEAREGSDNSSSRMLGCHCHGISSSIERRQHVCAARVAPNQHPGVGHGMVVFL